MASYSLSLGRGQTEFQIVEGTAVPGAGSIELRIDLAQTGTIVPETAIRGCTRDQHRDQCRPRAHS